MPGTEKIRCRDHRGRPRRVKSARHRRARRRTALADYIKASESSLEVAKQDWVSHNPNWFPVGAEGEWLLCAQDFHGIQGSGPARGNVRRAERAKS
jgi:hypothetical protein